MLSKVASIGGDADVSRNWQEEKAKQRYKWLSNYDAEIVAI